jgi:dynein heavy chain
MTHTYTLFKPTYINPTPTHAHTHTHTLTHTLTHTHTHPPTHTHTHTHKQTNKHTHKQTNKQTNKQTQGMEDMAQCLEINQVPGRNPFHACSWERLAWASRKNLATWFTDLLQRRNQLADWSKSLQLPFSIWLPGLVNPTALLTAIKQVTSRKKKLPLDSMSLDTHVTRMYRVADALMSGVYPEDGILVHGLLMEGARWTDEEESSDHIYSIGNTSCAGKDTN